jgi:hypothetical protein
VRVSFEFARLDTSKSCDSHAIIVREEPRDASLPETDVACSVYEEKAGECDVADAEGCFAST